LHVYDLKYGYAGVGVSIYTSQDYLCKIKEILVSMKTEDDLLGGFWFLKELFWGNVIFFVMLKVFNSIKYCKIWIVLLLLSLTVLLRYTMWHIHFVNVNWLSFYAAAFIAIGYAVSGYFSFVMSKKWIIVLLSLIFISAVYFRTENFGVMEQQINTIIPYFVSAVSATLLIYVFLTRCESPPRVFKYLSFVGQHTLIILTLHFLSFKIVSLLIVMCYSLPYNRIAEFPVIFEYASKGWWVLYTIVGVIVPLFSVYCFDKVKTFFSEYKYGV
jgi:fucose 4-O-acetylase-like acetyltransferase